MTHLLTGSDDGYIRDYDIFTAVNGKTFLSAPQRHQAGVVEGLMKAGQIKFWWENPAYSESRKGFVGGQANHGTSARGEEGLAPVYSMLMQSDALWALTGSDTGHINLFTVRHEPGRLAHVMDQHKSPISAMSMDHGEKGFFSASWDGEAIQWDLNTGTHVRKFTAHHSQLTSIAVRPAYSGPYVDPTPTPVAYRRKEKPAPAIPSVASGHNIGVDDKSHALAQDDMNISSPGNGNDTNSLFGDDPADEVDDKNGITGLAPLNNLGDSVSQQQHQQQSGQTGIPSQPSGGANVDGDDTKSEASFADSLFGDDGDDDDANAGTKPATEPVNQPPTSQNPYMTNLAIPSNYHPQAPSSQFVTFPINGPNEASQHPQHLQQQFFAPQGFPAQYGQPPYLPAGGQQSRAPPPPQGRPAKSAPVSIAPPKNAPPLLDSSSYSTFSSDLLMGAFVDGQVVLWDRRVSTAGKGVARLWMSEKTPPWCLSACWSQDGGQIYAGRRNSTVDVWDVRLMGKHSMTETPRLLKTLRNPTSSGVVSCVAAFPDCRHIASASVDNIRLWNVADAPGDDSSMAKPRSGAQFKIIPGHHGGYISHMLIDPGARFMVTASSNRGLYGDSDSTRTVFVHDIKLAF